jgi:hypothetical protein
LQFGGAGFAIESGDRFLELCLDRSDVALQQYESRGFHSALLYEHSMDAWGILDAVSKHYSERVQRQQLTNLCELMEWYHLLATLSGMVVGQLLKRVETFSVSSPLLVQRLVFFQVDSGWKSDKGGSEEHLHDFH